MTNKILSLSSPHRTKTTGTNIFEILYNDVWYSAMLVYVDKHVVTEEEEEEGMGKLKGGS